VVFAPGIVSSEGNVDFSSAFSPDGTEFYFSRRKPDGPNQLLVSKLQDDNTWTAPEVVAFAKNYDASEASVSPDGNFIFFGSREFQSSSSTVWYSERTDSGWGEPTQLHEEMMYATLSRNRHLYYTDKSGDNIGTGLLISATFDAGELSDVKGVSIATESGMGNAHPYIAPDESYLIYDRLGDLYITFKEDDGAWSSSRRLNSEINTPAFEFAPSVTPDGKYFFFTREDNVYWVSMEVIHP
jgi:Tol biopolymer transport system component